jgi:hypothetical protein
MIRRRGVRPAICDSQISSLCLGRNIAESIVDAALIPPWSLRIAHRGPDPMSARISSFAACLLKVAIDAGGSLTRISPAAHERFT